MAVRDRVGVSIGEAGVRTGVSARTLRYVTTSRRTSRFPSTPSARSSSRLRIRALPIRPDKLLAGRS